MCAPKVRGKIKARDIVKSVNLFMAIEWGKLQRWTNSTSSLVYRKLIYNGRPYLKGDGRYRYDSETQQAPSNIVKERISSLVNIVDTVIATQTF